MNDEKEENSLSINSNQSNSTKHHSAQELTITANTLNINKQIGKIDLTSLADTYDSFDSESASETGRSEKPVKVLSLSELRSLSNSRDSNDSCKRCARSTMKLSCSSKLARFLSLLF